MLNIDTLKQNKKAFNPNPNDAINSFGIWDLTTASISYDGVDMKARKIFVVPDYMTMRPDLIALYQMGDPEACGSLMKANNISNPFAIDEGQNMYIITPQLAKKTYESKRNKLASQSVSRDNTPLEELKKAQENKIFKVSEGRKKFLEKNIKKSPQLVLPPNVSQPGTRKFERKGQVFTFAPDAGGGGFNRPLNRE